MLTGPEEDAHNLVCLVHRVKSCTVCLFLALDSEDRLLDHKAKCQELYLHVDPSDEAVSLRDLFKAIVPTLAAKLVINLILARALLHLFGSLWASRDVSIDDVSVFCHVEGQTPQPLFNKIFISTHFEPEVASQKDQAQGFYSPHPFPSILALGILMARIELGGDLDDDEAKASGRGYLSNKKCVRRPVETGKKLLGKCELILPKGSGVLRSIRFCMKRESFSGFSHIPFQELHEDPKFRDHYYANIVRPLEEELVTGAGWSWDEVELLNARELESSGIFKTVTANAVLPVALKSAHPSRARYQSILSPLGEQGEEETSPGQSQKCFNILPLCAFDSEPAPGILAEAESHVFADEWFRELEEMHKVLHVDRMESLTKDEMEDLVKIAVIDTGVDFSHPSFKDFIKSGQLDRGLDLVDNGECMVDHDGHGTHTCHLLFKTAPYAKVYPMRVFKTMAADKSTPELINKAIHHAIDIWDVDIISMSFSFHEEELKIRQALEFVASRTNKPVLLFAAASNNRGLLRHRIGYPARDTDHVICVNSSKAPDRKSDFSPAGLSGRPNISVVGEDVEAAWPLHLNNGKEVRRMRGTSCATPIAAGIAALILEFSRKDAPEVEILSERVAYLKQTSGMRSVLKRCMTDNHGDERYNFLRPWVLFRENWDAVSREIDEALEFRYL
ncbi:subtilisin-like protein [Acephala macrosclerotiorum]|nr:subtilisin-like protein [Acephala macrosclerotiorum]